MSYYTVQYYLGWCLIVYIYTFERIQSQRRSTKVIAKLRDLSYEERLKECGLTTVETGRLRVDQIEVSKILNGYKKY